MAQMPKGGPRSVPDPAGERYDEIVGAEMHGRLTVSYKGKSQFNTVERYFRGTPTWSKVGTGAAVGHPGGAAKAQSEKRQ